MISDNVIHMSPSRICGICILISTLLAGCASSAHAQSTTSSETEASVAAEQNQYAIQQVTDDLYRFTAGHHHSVFLVTDRGILVTDPIDSDTATWLKSELNDRFDVPVRYVVYSHSHTDHVYGGDVFDEPGVTFVSHRMARDALERTRADTTLPDVVFDDNMTLHLGSHDIQLTYHGPNNGRGSISMLFRTIDTLFVVDWIVLGRMPYKDLPGYDLPGMIDSTREVLEFDFDTFVGGHAEIGSPDDIRRYLSYLEALHDGVLQGIRDGKSLADIKRDLTLEDFSDLARYDDWRPLNIEGAYRYFRDEAYLLRRPDIPKP